MAGGQQFSSDNVNVIVAYDDSCPPGFNDRRNIDENGGPQMG